MKQATNEIPILFPALVNTVSGRKYGFINERGGFSLPPIYEQAYDFTSKNTAIVKSNDLYGLINSSGFYDLSPRYEGINQFKEKRAIFSSSYGMGVMNEQGTTLNTKYYSFINDYQESMAVFSINNEADSPLYGYLALNGTEAIPPIYESAEDFQDGLGLVKRNEKEWALITTSGELIATYPYPLVSQYGNGLLLFSTSLGGPYGYINSKGEEVIKPQFQSAQGFRNGVAIVSEQGGYQGPYGLIDVTGHYIYEPIYSDIRLLGEERVALGKSIGSDPYASRNLYAIGDNRGTRFTNFMYRDVGEYDHGVAYASNQEYTFFINAFGKRIPSLPTVKGSGSLIKKDPLIYADIDYEPYYLLANGTVVYKPNTIVPLSPPYKVQRAKYKPNINYLIYYPILSGITPKSTQLAVNTKLRQLSDFSPPGEDGTPKQTTIHINDILPYDYYGTFELLFYKKHLLVLDLSGYYYPLGAAHGMPTKKTPTIDLTTGQFYTLSDLFMGGVYWVGELNKILQEMITTDPQYDSIFKEEFHGITPDQSFYVDGENLYLYYAPYDIAPYAAGFVTFKIPWSSIQGMLNKQGAFYQAFLS